MAATLLGLAINFPVVQNHIHLSPIKALVWAAVINGVAGVPIMVVIMLMCHNEAVMGPFVRISRGLKVMGWLATAAMIAATAGSVYPRGAPLNPVAREAYCHKCRPAAGWPRRSGNNDGAAV